MKANKLFFAALASAALSAGAWAQTAVSAQTPAPSPITASDVQALKDALAAQQRQIDKLTQQLEGQQSQKDAAGNTAAAQVQTVSQQQPAELKNAVLVQQDGHGLNIQDTQSAPSSNPMQSPVISIHFKGITITPGDSWKLHSCGVREPLERICPPRSIR